MAYQAGQKLGNYQLERFLGYGGFAEVYLGKHIYLNTRAAIKVLQRQSNDTVLEEFLQEARIIASLKHPHIVGVLEFGIEEQHPFLVMAYAPHGTLRRRYARGQSFLPGTILPRVKQVADALQYAHDRKIIHRDVKPENMLLDEDDTVLLSDFGLAMKERISYHSVQSTDSAGTTIYMAPEQLRGKPLAASDQYALGVVIYEWLCGCLPFEGPDVSVVVQHLHEAPAPLREHVPTLSPAVEAVVLKALEKDPKQRFASVQELAVAFERACSNMPLTEDVVALPIVGVDHYKDVSFSTEFIGAQQDEITDKRVKASNRGSILLEDTEMPIQSFHNTSLRAPSLSASLNMDTSIHGSEYEHISMGNRVSDSSSSTGSLQGGAPISRRKLIAGIAGIGAVLGGVGIWRLSSTTIGSLSRNILVPQKSSGVVTAVTTSNGHTSGNTGKSSPLGTGKPSKSPHAGSKGTVKNGATNPTTTVNKSASTGAPTPSIASSPSGNGNSSVATSTPDLSGGNSGSVPTATDTPATQSNAALTVQMSNVPFAVQDGTTTYISVTTNISNTAFQFEADYLNIGNFFGQSLSDSLNGTTDNSGNATVSWTPSLTAGELFFHKYAKVYVVATDQNGNSVYSQTVQVQITRF